jgi:hypothetical protein
MMTTEEIIEWSEQQDAAGVKDAMGYPWTSWLLALRKPDGTYARDAVGHQVFQTQSEYKRLHATRVGQTMSLFE